MELVARRVGSVKRPVSSRVARPLVDERCQVLPLAVAGSPPTRQRLRAAGRPKNPTAVAPGARRAAPPPIAWLLKARPTCEVRPVAFRPQVEARVA